MVTFREYQEEDRDILSKLAIELEEYAKSVDSLKRVQNLPGFAEISFVETMEKVQNNQSKIWLAEEDGNIVGYVIGVIWKQSEKNKLEIGPHKLGEIIDIYLKEKYRKQGLGTKMLQMMEDYFKQEGCDSMWTEVFAPNTGAHKLYNKFGFIDREIGLLKQI